MRPQTVICILILFTLADSVFANEPRMSVQCGGLVGGDCFPGKHGIWLAGSQCPLVIRLTHCAYCDTAFERLPTDPPAGLSIIAGFPSDELNTGRPGLYEKFLPTFYLTQSQIRQGSIFDNLNPEYCFLLTIPRDLADSSVWFRATLRDPGIGEVYGVGGLRIAAPCSQNDRDQVMATHVRYAHDRGDNERAVALVDSLLDTGWHYWYGLLHAMNAANQIGRYDRELAYLDACYYANGTVWPGLTDPVKAEKEYCRRRDDILMRLAEQRGAETRR